MRGYCFRRPKNEKVLKQTILIAGTGEQVVLSLFERLNLERVITWTQAGMLYADFQTNMRVHKDQTDDAMILR